MSYHASHWSVKFFDAPAASSSATSLSSSASSSRRDVASAQAGLGPGLAARHSWHTRIKTGHIRRAGADHMVATLLPAVRVAQGPVRAAQLTVLASLAGPRRHRITLTVFTHMEAAESHNSHTCLEMPSEASRV